MCSASAGALCGNLWPVETERECLGPLGKLGEGAVVDGGAFGSVAVDSMLACRGGPGAGRFGESAIGFGVCSLFGTGGATRLTTLLTGVLSLGGSDSSST